MFGKILLSALSLSGVAGITLGTIGLGGTGQSVNSQRTDCPENIICPLNGDEVCKDQCPLIDENRADCEGKIGCPLTGNLAGKDQCQVNQNTVEDVAEKENKSDTVGSTPSCCTNRN